MKVLNTSASVDIGITNQCNLRCKYCSHFSGAGDVGQDLPTQEWLEFFEELNRCAVMKVTLQGGEPFYREDLPRLVEGIVRNRMRFNILTNGTMITHDIAAFLAATGRCDTIQVSLDGSTPASHDVFRGKGSFFRAIEGIKCLQHHGLPVSVRVTLHRKNIADLKGTAELLLEELNLSRFSTNSAGYMGLCRQNTGLVQLTVDDRTEVMQRLVELHHKYHGRISATAGPLAEARTWCLMEQARRESRERIPGGGYLTGCNGPMETIAVRADGMVVPCIQMSHMELGRINRDDLQTIWKEHPELRRLRERHHVRLSDFEFCHQCDYMNYCTGNCPALAYMAYGQENHPSPEGCLKRFLAAGGRLPASETSISPDIS